MSPIGNKKLSLMRGKAKIHLFLFFVFNTAEFDGIDIDFF